MSFYSFLTQTYRHWVRFPLLDRAIRTALDASVEGYARIRRFSFPETYIRQWKLDMLLERYERDTAALCRKKIRQGMVIADIGAHIGYYTRIFSELVGPEGLVIAFEADPHNFALLKKNTQHLKNVRLFAIAVSDRTGPIDFYHYDQKSGIGSTLANVPLDFQKKKLTVSAETLDAILAREGIARVDAIKMDIEGGEAAALRGMQNLLDAPEALTLILEFAPRWIRAAGGDPSDFLRFLAEKRFAVAAIGRSGLAPVSPKSFGEVENILPKTSTGCNEFVNLYCERPPLS